MALADIPFLGGYEQARAANEARGMNELKTASGAMGLLAQIQAQQQKREALARQEKFRQGLAALGPNATQEQLAQLAAQHVDDPAKLMDVQQKSLDRKATLEATSAQRAATLAQQREAMLGRLEQQAQSAAQIHEYRLGRLQNETERNAEIARRNTEMEAFRRRQQQVDEQFKRMGLNIQQGTLDLRRDIAAQGGNQAPVAVIGPDGKAVYVARKDAIGKTPVAGEKPLTEFQGKNVLYGTRAAQSDKILKELESKISLTGLAATRTLGPAGNFLRSSEQRRVDQAQRDFVNAVLRQESGAVISDAEFENAQKQYFPQPGDDAKTIEQKRSNRALAIKGFTRIAGSGGADIDAIRTAPLLPSQPAAPATGGWSIRQLP